MQHIANQEELAFFVINNSACNQLNGGQLRAKLWNGKVLISEIFRRNKKKVINIGNAKISEEARKHMVRRIMSEQRVVTEVIIDLPSGFVEKCRRAWKVQRIA